MNTLSVMTDRCRRWGLAGLVAAVLASTAQAQVPFVDTYDPPETLNDYLVDRKDTTQFQTEFFDGDWRLLVGLDEPNEANTFVNFQGRMRITDETPNNYYNNLWGYVAVDLYIPPEVANQNHFPMLWVQTTDYPDNTYTAWSILGFRSYDDGSEPVLRVWDGPDTEAESFGPNNGWQWTTLPLPSSFEYGWNNFRFEMMPGSFDWYVNGELVFSDPSAALFDQCHVELAFLQAYNFGTAYDTYFDNLAVGIVPEPSTVTLMAVGVAGMGWYGWRRRRKKIAV